jgi:hypothetical protein
MDIQEAIAKTQDAITVNRVYRSFLRADAGTRTPTPSLPCRGRALAPAARNPLAKWD